MKLTRQEVRRLVLREIERAGSAGALARQWGVSKTYLSHIVHRKRNPGPTILRRMGLAVTWQRTPHYRPIEEQAHE